MNVKKSKGILVGVAILAIFLLSACSGPDEHIWLKSPGWSRAAFLGNTILNDPVPMTLDDEGQIYFVLLSADEERIENKFEIVALDPNGLPLWTNSLNEITISRADNPQIVWDAGKLRLFWIDKANLYTLPLDAQGVPLENTPIRLSAEIEVDTYSLATDASGQITVWFTGARKNPGVYALSTSDGNGQITSVAPEGIRAEIRYDDNDTLHVTWLEYPVGYGKTRLMYGNYPKGAAIESVTPQVIHELTVGPTSTINGPVMGIDEENAYIFWTIILRTGLDAGATRTNYLSFPLGEATAASEPTRLVMPLDYTLPYEEIAASAFTTGDRASLQGERYAPTDTIQEIVTNPMQSGEMAIIFRSPKLYLWRKVRDQVNIAYFSEGMPASYQPLTFTTTLSTSPNIINGEKYIYASWLEKVETDFYAVYFASTSPGIEESLSRSSGAEIGRIAAQISFGILVGILMAPVAAGVWVVAPLVILFLFSPLRKFGSNRVRDIMGAISLLFALAAFWMGKMAMLPGMMDYVPFSAWVPEIPQALGEILRWVIPIGNALLAIFVAWYYTYRQSNKSTLYFLLIYVGVDSVLTAAIYAVLVYGAI